MITMNAERVAHTLAVGMRGWDAFCKGMTTNEWDDFLAMLTDDFEFFFPSGEWNGLHHGKAKAAEYFALVKKIAPGGFTIVELMHTSVNEDTIVFEFKDEALMFGKEYKNRVAMSWNIRGEQICGQREYFGSDGKSY